MNIVNSFIGREKEIGILKTAIEKHQKGICIYGPRRVGKTALIRKVLSTFDSSTYIYYECIKGSFEYNVELLANEIARVLKLSYISKIRDIFELFVAIERECKDKHMVVVLDEYPYMREQLGKGVLDSYLQRIIDSINDNITIILSGSYVTVMKEILEISSPLFGRFERMLEVKPFSYIEASRFYPSLPIRDKIAFYSVFGGYPFALKMIDRDKSLSENIIINLLDEGNIIRNVLENVLFIEASRNGMPIELLSRIGNGRMRYSEIENSMSGDVSGTLDRTLKRLIGMGIVEKTSPINRKNDKKKTFYEIKDNLLRFFFTYIEPNKAMIARTEGEIFYKTIIEPSLNTFISKRFENICREYFTFVSGLDVLDIGTYWYDDNKNHTNGEFDCVLKTVDGNYKFYEVKYLKDPMNEELYKKERMKMARIPISNISSYGFISSSGFSFSTQGLGDDFITGEEIYSINK